MRNVVLLGDVREKLRDVPDSSVQTCVTSPPYFNLRDYGHAGQIGLETTVPNPEYHRLIVERLRPAIELESERQSFEASDVLVQE